MTPADIERMFNEAIANGADPDKLAAARDAAIKEAGGSMESLAYNMGVHIRLQRFLRTLGFNAEPSREEELAQLSAFMAKYPDEAEKMAEVLRNLPNQRTP